MGDVDAMKEAVRVMSADEFLEHVRQHPDLFGLDQGGLSQLAIIDANHNHPSWLDNVDTIGRKILDGFDPNTCVVGDVPSALMDPEYSRRLASFAEGRNSIALSQEEIDATVVWIPKERLLGNFYGSVFLGNNFRTWQLRKAVRRAVRLRREYFVAAEAALASVQLTPGAFGAMHIRQDDWSHQFMHMYLNASDPEKFLDTPTVNDFLGSHGKMYLAVQLSRTEAHDVRTKLLPYVKSKMRQPKQIVMLDDVGLAIKAQAAGRMKFPDAIVEMLICAQARTFVGNWGSTFTGYIQRLRGYMPAVLDSRHLFFDASQDDKGSYPSWKKADENAEVSLMREWPEGAQFRTLRPARHSSQP